MWQAVTNAFLTGERQQVSVPSAYASSSAYRRFLRRAAFASFRLCLSLALCCACFTGGWPPRATFLGSWALGANNAPPSYFRVVCLVVPYAPFLAEPVAHRAFPTLRG